MAPPHDQPRTVRLPPAIVRQRRLRLADHVMRRDEAANKVLLWKPDGPRRRGRPTTTLQNILEKYSNLSGTNLIAAMKNRNLWKEIIMSPHYVDDISK